MNDETKEKVNNNKNAKPKPNVQIKKEPNDDITLVSGRTETLNNMYEIANFPKIRYQ